MINKIGVRGHDYGALMPKALCETLKKDGYKALHLALKKSFGEMETYLGEDQAKSLGTLLKNEAVKLSVLGCYLNYSQFDEEKRQANLQKCFRHLERAHDFGAACIASETFTLNSDNKRHPEDLTEIGYSRVVESYQQIMAKAEKEAVDFAVEPVALHIINTPQRLQRLKEDLNSPRFKVIFDPVNLITPDNYQDQRTIMDEMLTLFKDEIIVLHAKDFVIEEGCKKIVAPGEGLLDYDYLMKGIKGLKQGVDVIAEGNPRETLNETYRFLSAYEAI